MLKKTITYEDYNGETLTEDFYFNLNKAELIALELTEKGGLANKMKEIVESEDGAQIIATFKELILTAYGIKSEDGKRFIKSEDLRMAFEQTEAFSELFIELATNAKSAAEFVNGVVPASLAAEVDKATAELAVQGKDPSAMSKEELLELISKRSQ